MRQSAPKKGAAGLAKPGRGSAGSAEPSVRQTTNAAVQPSARLGHQSAKPKGGKAVSRLARASQSPLSSEEGSEASGSSEEEGDEEGSSEEEEEEEEDEEGSSEEGEQADSTRQKLAVESLRARSSSQQGDDSDDYPDDSFPTRAQDSLNPDAEATPSQQQQQQAQASVAQPAASTRADSPQQFSHREHTEHMHVAVRARPVPPGASASCWVVDPNAATIALDGTATAAKRKQALYGSNAARSSTTGGLDSGQSRGFLGTAPGTPGIGFWDSSAPAGTSMGYKFDQVLAELCSTAVVYSRCIQSLVQSALEGVNGTVLAYGELTTYIAKSPLQKELSQPSCALQHCCVFHWHIEKVDSLNACLRISFHSGTHSEFVLSHRTVSNSFRTFMCSHRASLRDLNVSMALWLFDVQDGDIHREVAERSGVYAS